MTEYMSNHISNIHNCNAYLTIRKIALFIVFIEYLKTIYFYSRASGDLVTLYDRYDAEGNLTSMTDAKGQSFTYAYV